MGVMKREKISQRNGMGLPQLLTTTISFCSSPSVQVDGIQIAGVVPTLKSLSVPGPVIPLVMLQML